MNQGLPKARVERRHLPVILIWLLPLVVLGLAGLYYQEYFSKRGPEIVIHFPDASGLKENETRLVYRGVEMAKVDSVDLSDDHKQALVHIRLPRKDSIFASKGAVFWIVRPEVSQSGLKGLDTLMTGPYVQAQPGEGKEYEDNFTGLTKEPRFRDEGLRIVLTSRDLGHVQDESTIAYKGIPVGKVEEIMLAPDATHVVVKGVVWTRYAHLVKSGSHFWVDSGFDVKGGIFAGVHMKLDSLKTVISGGISFATPEKDAGVQSKDDATFPLEEDPKKEWKEWSPPLSVNPKAKDAPVVKANFPMGNNAKKK